MQKRLNQEMKLLCPFCSRTIRITVTVPAGGWKTPKGFMKEMLCTCGAPEDELYMYWKKFGHLTPVHWRRTSAQEQTYKEIVRQWNEKLVANNVK